MSTVANHHSIIDMSLIIISLLQIVTSFNTSVSSAMWQRLNMFIPDVNVAIWILLKLTLTQSL